MSQTFVRLFAGFLLAIGGGLTGYLFYKVPPYQSSGELDSLVVGLLFFSLLVGFTGLATLLALQAHKRWPALAGSHPNKQNPAPKRFASVALRQGFLASISLCAVILFSMLQILDSIFIFVIILISGLIETYFQSLE